MQKVRKAYAIYRLLGVVARLPHKSRMKGVASWKSLPTFGNRAGARCASNAGFPIDKRFLTAVRGVEHLSPGSIGILSVTQPGRKYVSGMRANS